MFKIPDHQVAGHQASNGMMGPLVDDSGLFFKPLQKDDRGSKEVAFYKSFSSNTEVPDKIRTFFPAFHGTRDIPASDGSGLHPHLVLEDLISNYENPSIVDIKIGSRTWYPQASEEYIQRCFKKDRQTSSLALGFRLSGLQIHVSQKAGYWKPERKFLQNSSAEKVKIILKKFVSSNVSADSDVDDLDCVFAPSVYGGSNGILATNSLLRFSLFQYPFSDSTLCFNFHLILFLSDLIFFFYRLMVVKLVRWPSWPPFSSRKYETIINLRRLEGLTNQSVVKDDASGGLVMEIKWKGQKIMGLSSWRRSVKRNYTEKGNVCEEEGGLCVDWNEEFTSLCSFLGSNKEDLIPPWKVSLKLLQKGENQVLRNSYTVIGTASLNLAEYASKADGKEIQISLPLKLRSSTAEFSPLLLLSLNLLELRTDTKPLRMVQRSIMPVTLSPTSPLALSTEKDGLAVIRAGLDRVKIFRHCVSAGRPKEVFHEEDVATVNRFYIKDKDSTQSSSLDTDSVDDDDGNEDSCVRQPFGYEKLAHANRVAGLLLPGTKTANGDDDCWIYCGNGAGCLDIDSDSSQTMQQNSMRKILLWRKRKLSFKSPKIKGEPLLKKHYGEDGGDDIDFDRRQLSTNELFSWWYNLELSAAAFGDDNFAVGSWEQKEVASRDGCLKIKTEVFFASIDQRSERASGESACTALVAVIADWLLSNQDEMPIKSELDNLIRDGSAEWRNLCENKDYMEQFSDKHFDLDTVIGAKIRPLSVVAEKSYVGFFHPEGLEEEGVFEFLKGAMSFDTIWDEISLLAADLPTNAGELIVYIVSWNDHFFILKVDKDAYYIIDTLGERLYEGCNQAYILKFDKETVIHRLPNNTKASEEKSSNNTKESTKSTGPPDEKTSIDTKQSKSSGPSKEKSSTIKKNQSKSTEISQVDPSTHVPQLNNPEILEENPSMDVVQPSDSEEAPTLEPPSSLKEASTEEKNESGNSNIKEEEVVCTGKECCQEYIKSFLAAIPIRELLEDVKKNGLSSSTPLHQRLQIEFHRAKVILGAADQILANND